MFCCGSTKNQYYFLAEYDISTLEIYLHCKAIEFLFFLKEWS